MRFITYKHDKQETKQDSIFLPLFYLVLSAGFSLSHGHKQLIQYLREANKMQREPGEPLVIEDIEVDPPKAYEVRIKILCSALCHTDLTFWKLPAMPLFPGFPKILGHESVGVVESTGEHVEQLKVNDIVLPVFHPNCEECRDCRSQKSNWCAKFCEDFSSNTRRYGDSSRFRGSNGETINHFLFVSSFSEYTVVDIAHLVKIPSSIPVQKASLLSCGVSTGIGAAWKVANVEEGSTVAIFGLGAVGLAVAEGARLRGSSKIIGVDLNPEKFKIGKKFGVTDFIDPANWGEKSVSEMIKEMTDGGADYCFECIGLASLMNDAFASSRLGSGKTVILGMEKHGSPLSVNTYELLQGKTISGSLFGGMKPKSDIPILVEKYLNKELNLDGIITHDGWLQELNLDGIITHEVSFDEINKAFELLEEGKCIRCVIWMNK